MKKLKRKDINDLHTEIGHPLEENTWAMGMAVSLQITIALNPCKNCALGKAKMAGVSKMAVPCLMVKVKRLFIDINFPSGGMKCCFFVVEDSTDCA